MIEFKAKNHSILFSCKRLYYNAAKLHNARGGIGYCMSSIMHSAIIVCYSTYQEIIKPYAPLTPNFGALICCCVLQERSYITAPFFWMQLLIVSSVLLLTTLFLPTSLTHCKAALQHNALKWPSSPSGPDRHGDFFQHSLLILLLPLMLLGVFPIQ